MPALVNLANLHYARDELIEAQALYERAIRLEPDCFEAHFNLGNILHDLGRFESGAVATAAACAESRLRRRALLPGGHPREDRPFAEAQPHWKAYQDLAPREVDGAGAEFLENELEAGRHGLEIREADRSPACDLRPLDARGGFTPSVR